MKKYQPTGLALLSGFLLWIAWPVSPFTLFIFIAWVPLLFLASFTEKRLQFFFYTFLATLVWNASTTWWIWNSTDVGSIAAIIANSLLMTLPWWGYHIVKKKLGKPASYISLIVFWMTFEYIHLNWQLSWPWLTLGNVFALHPDWVQWYEYTGTSGGTLWILIVNILLYNMVKQIRNKRYNKPVLLAVIAVIVFPVIISYFLKPASQENKMMNGSANGNIVIAQPNIDPYSEKFDAATVNQQLNILISLSEQKIDKDTKLVVWPETALSYGVWEDELANSPIYKPVFAFVNRHPDLMLLTGIESFKNYGAKKLTNTARLDENDNSYYDVFNAAVLIQAGKPLQFYDKSKLVPGVETLPDFLMWMAPVFEKFGGTASGYGKSKESAVLSEDGNPFKCAPIICYESIYGEYVASYVNKGANVLAIITNDGWWGNTPGHKQHLEYARLRAIETRKWVVRSANTGISAVINSNGDILQTQPWDKAAAIKARVPALAGETFYVKYGDILSKIAIAFAALLVAWNALLQMRLRPVKKIKQ